MFCEFDTSSARSERRKHAGAGVEDGREESVRFGGLAGHERAT